MTDRDRYLERIGLDPATVTGPDGIAGERADADADGGSDAETLRRLQQAHVGTVPFETLSINGHPFDDADPGEGVSLSLPDLYEKVVERRRGGFCFELNGLFGWLLGDLGFDADRVAARVVGDGDSRPPANHHTHLVHLDRTYVVDVGLGSVALRRPLPLDGTVVTDEADVTWRVVEGRRSNADCAVQYRPPGEDWGDRYHFRTTPRHLVHFEATCEYLATDPESHFTGEAVATITTEDGYAKLSPDELLRWRAGDEATRPVAPTEWEAVLEQEFGIASGME